MMTKSADTAQGRDAADASAEFGRLAAEMLQNSHPLMANPAAAMAAATAIGFGFSTQMAGAFWGALQGAVEATNKLAAALEERNGVTHASPDVAQDDVVKKAVPAVKVAASGKGRAKARPAIVKLSPEAIAPVRLKAAPAESAAAPKVQGRGRKTAADDLKRISGVGPKLETVLKDRGIRSFADIASWSDADVARIDADLGFEGRIAKDDWVGQARALLGPMPTGRK
jgi:NADH-quinone oxidoreductase subunit E